MGIFMSENRDLINSMTSPTETIRLWVFPLLLEEKRRRTILTHTALNLCKWKGQKIVRASFGQQ